MSILGNLLCKELGEHKYYKYFDCFKKGKGKNEVIFCDMYRQLKDKDIEMLYHMLERLRGATALSVRVCKQYIWVWLATVVTIIVLIVLPISFLMTLVGICVVVTAFGYKSIVYLINRYCYIDVGIIMIYRIVLYHLILTYKYV